MSCGKHGLWRWAGALGWVVSTLTQWPNPLAALRVVDLDRSKALAMLPETGVSLGLAYGRAVLHPTPSLAR